MLYGDRQVTSEPRYFAEGIWYGSMRSVGACYGYFSVVLVRLASLECGRRAVTFPTRDFGHVQRRTPVPTQLAIPAPRNTRSQQKTFSAQFDGYVLEAIVKFCRQFPGTAVMTSGPGARPVIPELRTYKLEWDIDQEVIFSSASLACVSAAIVNGVQFTLGNEAAWSVREWWLSSGQRPATLGRAGALISGLGLRLVVKKPDKMGYLHAGRYDVVFQETVKWEVGIWWVRLTKTSHSRIDHCVLLNAFLELIIDPAEAYRIRLSSNRLCLCVLACKCLKFSRRFCDDVAD